jgi:cytochrome c5
MVMAKPRKNRVTLYTVLIGIITFALLSIWEQHSSITSSPNTSSSMQANSVKAAASPEDGKAIYKQHCLACHAVDGHGNGEYPDIASDKFKKKFTTFDKVYEFVSRNMPQDDPGSLSEGQYKAVVKYVQSLNGIATDFADINGYFAEQEIYFLWDKQIVDGTSTDGKLYYKPNQNITRAEFVRYLVKAKGLYITNSSETSFTDISKSKDKAYILTAVEYGYINGYEDSTFRPNQSITRAEIAAILTRSELLTASTSAAFTDVPSSHWANAVIGAVQSSGLFNGYEDGTFHPSNPITRGESAAVLYRLLNPSGS